MQKNLNFTNDYLASLNLSKAVPLRSRRLLKTDDPQLLQNQINEIMHEHRKVTTKAKSTSSFVLNRLAFNEAQILGVVHTDELHVTSEKLETVHVVVPLRGGVVQNNKNQENLISPGKGSVMSPGQVMNMRWAANTAAFSLQVHESTVQRYLVDYFDISPYKKIKFDKAFNWEKSSALSLREMFSRICFEALDPNSLLCRGITASAVEEQLILTLIDALPSNYSSEITNRIDSVRATHIKQVVEYITENGKSNIKAIDLVRLSGVSLRTLQSGFQKHYGIGVMTYVRRFKLSQIREALKRADPHQDKVGDIAAQWGFYHSSNFSNNYRNLFGEYPSDTLNQYYNTKRGLGACMEELERL